MQMKISASLASADPLNLSGSIRAVERAGIDRLHLDIEDGNFVPNITFGQKVVRAVRASTALPLDVHLMTTVSEQILEEFRNLKIEYLSVHFEAVGYPLRALSLIRRNGARAGLALNPRTPIDDVAYALPFCDYLLLMTNEPDTLGERFLDSAYRRISAARRLFVQMGKPDAEIAVDGAIDTDNTRAVVTAGATVVVSGRAIFGLPEIEANVHALRMAGIRAD